MRTIIPHLVTEYRQQSEIASEWRDQWGKPYGCGPDAWRKALVCLEMLRAYGYRVGTDDCLYFDVRLARELDIPEANWPAGAGDD